MPEEKPQSAARQGVSDTLSLMKTIVITIVFMLFITNCVIANAIIPTGSMEHTIEPGDRIIGMRFLKNYERGNIVIFPDPDGSGNYLIKRIIGMPGERLTIERNPDTQTCSVYINGIELKEPYLAEAMESSPEFENLNLTIPSDSYFCMGDNRNHSYDARYWSNPFIKKENIIAKAAFCYWPLQDAGLLRTPNYEK